MNAAAENPEVDGQFDGIIDHCERYLDDCGDGIKDSKKKLPSWRPELLTVERVMSKRVKRLDGSNAKSSELHQDHLGNLIDELMDDLDAILGECFGGAGTADRTSEPVDQTSPAEPAETEEPEEVAAKEYYIRRGDKGMGPVFADNIGSGIADGRLKSTDQLSEQTSGPWQTLDTSEFSTYFQG